MMSSAAEQGQMSEEEIQSAENVVRPARNSIDSAIRTLDQKLGAADGAMKEELTVMKDKAAGFKKSVESVVSVLRKQRDSLGTREMLRTAGENIDVAEQALTKCTEAEMPFLKGIEILPAEESSKAIKDSETASSKAESAVNTAKNFIKTKLAEVKKYGKELAASVTEELNAHQQRLDAVSKKLTTFKKETSERKASALLAEVHESVTTAESAVKRMTEAAEVFFAEDLDSVSEDRLKQAKENTSAVEKEASEAVNEARKVFNAKRSGRGQENSDAMNKLHHRINAANGDLSKAKRAAASGDKL